MSKVIEGTYEGRDLRIAVIASRFSEAISKLLLEGALDSLKRHGVPEDSVTIAWVPGAFELPTAAQRFAESGEVDAIVCVGAVIKGETAHFRFVAEHALHGIGRVALDTGVPVTAGVLTTKNGQQAKDRAGGKKGNKGAEAAQAAIEMANLLAALPKPQL
jgi:6,7-dimethyl-8-ribityllumazine synthase